MLNMREDILTSLFNNLTQLKAAYPGIIIERNRDRDVQKFPALIMLDGSHKASYLSNGFTNYEMEIVVEGYVEATSSSNLGASINKLYCDVKEVMLTDVTTNGLTIDITEDNFDVEINRTSGTKPNAAFALSLTVYFIQAYQPE